MTCLAATTALNRRANLGTKRRMTSPLAALAARSRVAAVAGCLLLAATAAACSSSENGASSGGAGDGCKTGANAAFATPAGAPFALPSGVALEGEMTGDVNTAPCDRAEDVEYGGDLLPVCVGLRNTSGADVTVTFPAGLTFLVKNPDTQNGVILQDHALTVPAGAVKYFRFDLFCLNEHCAYGTKDDRFTFGNVSSDPGIRELVDLAKSRTLRRSASRTAKVFADAVWDVTGGKGLTSARKQEIASTPDGA